MQVRFDRVRHFLDYLDEEEQLEKKEFDLPKRAGNWAGPFIPGIRGRIDREIEWIERRLRENRERVTEDIRMYLPVRSRTR